MKLIERVKACWRGFWSRVSGAWNGGVSTVKNVASRWRMLLGILLGVLAAWLVLLPLAQPLTVWAWHYMPVLVVPTVGGLATAWLIRKRSRKAETTFFKQMAPVMALVVGTLALTGTVYFTNTSDWVIQSQMAEYLEPEELADLPQTIDSRFLPKPTAEEYARNATKDSQITTGEAHIVVTETDGKRHMWWQVPQPYTVWYWQMFGAVKSTVRVDAQSVEMNVDKVTGKDDFFLFGDQSLAVKWLFRIQHPFSEPARVVYWHGADGSRQILISYTSYRMTITGTMIPKMAGVMAIGPYGGSENFSPAEAKKRFPGAALFPPELGRKYAEAYALYHKGVNNKWFIKDDLLEVSEDTDRAAELNRAPFFQDIAGLGLQQVVALEPYGPDNFALSRVLFFDAVTGQARIYTVPFEKDLNGPRKAMVNIINGVLIPDLTKFIPIEPRLVNGPKGTYWLMTVVRADSKSHPFVMLVLVDAKTLKAHAFDATEEAKKFLAGKPARELVPEGR